jgi:hypothetical protein
VSLAKSSLAPVPGTTGSIENENWVLGTKH